MIRAGTARQVINNELGTHIQAAGHLKKVKYIRDDLEANALWLESGDCGIMFITCDIVGLDIAYVQQILPNIADAAGVPKESILIGCSHTHSGPSVLGPSHPDKPIEHAYLDRLRGWLCELAREAKSSVEPVQVAWGRGEAEIGYNRRVCLADGSHKMHGDPTVPDATGLEGLNDPQHTALFVRDLSGTLKAVLYNNTAHPVIFYGADFLSADYPGLARSFLRDVLGDINVLFFNGAIGDISIVDEFWKNRSPETREQKLARCAHLIAGETLRLLQHAGFKDELGIGHSMTRFAVGLRALSDERLAWAKQVMADYRAGKPVGPGLTAATAHKTLLLHERFGDKETETIDLHAGHIGGLAFATAPCEIFCHFGLQVKRRSPFPATAMFGVVSGDMGYCPTIEGVMGGSWEGTVALSSRWEEKAGYQIADELSRMLFGLKAEG